MSKCAVIHIGAIIEATNNRIINMAIMAIGMEDVCNLLSSSLYFPSVNKIGTKQSNENNNNM